MLDRCGRADDNRHMRKIPTRVLQTSTFNRARDALTAWMNSKGGKRQACCVSLRIITLSKDAGIQVEHFVFYPTPGALSRYIPERTIKILNQLPRPDDFPLPGTFMQELLGDALARPFFEMGIRRCPFCGKKFYRRKGNQKFCTRRCQLAHYKSSDAWRAHRREWTREHRQTLARMTGRKFTRRS